jgi:hypothetical protein
MNNNPLNEQNELSATGYLSVAVRTAEGAIPLENALVTVREGNSTDGDAIASFITDSGGLTPRIYLPTVPRERSESPGYATPYATYSVEVSLPGYHSNLYSNIPIFDGITSIQTAQLIPLPENGTSGTQVPEDVLIFDESSFGRLNGNGGAR